ncbi:MAG: glycosyltransferase [Actinobacteria bacterium]|nr:MAG: glycosyltransferase [Actinomycetota bacterium]
MRIATINASVLGGGAEAVALALHTEYLRLGHDAWLLVGNPNAERPGVMPVPNDRYRSPWARTLRRAASAAARRSTSNRDLWWYADRALRSAAEPGRYSRVARGHEDFDQPGTAHLLELTPRIPEVLHFHNLHGSYFDIRRLPQLTARVPSVLTLHDAWLMTGHCAHPFECERWLTGCETCPYLDRYVPLMADAAADNFSVKRVALGASSIAFASPSRWLLDMAEKSGVLQTALDARVIPNGIDTDIFSPGDRNVARAKLGIAPDATVLLSVGKDIATNPYKGFETLVEACERLAGRGSDAKLIAIGSDAPPRRFGGMEVRFAPFISDSAALATYYRAADVYVHPAQAEVLGLTIIEAMACGLPVAASDVGGIPEVIEHGANGLLFRAGDAIDLAEKLTLLLGDAAVRTHLGANGEKRARERFSVRAQAQSYLSYYADTAARRERRS